MPLHNVLDTHIHLWPSTSVSPTDHGWMTPGHVLAKRYSISDYTSTTASTSLVQPSGFIYVETDRYLPRPLPLISAHDSREVRSQRLRDWAHQPLEELKFLCRIVEARPDEGDGFDPRDGDRMVGCVIWAPFQLPTELFELYLQIAEQVSGSQLWKRVVGFRYLLQGLQEENEAQRLVESHEWLQNVLRLRNGRDGKGWSFDVGVDAHRDGVRQVEIIADMVEKIREMEGDGRDGRVRFILDHLCKPDLSTSTTPWPSLPRWKAALTRLSTDPAVYIKLSGAFNEFSPLPTPSTATEIIRCLHPYVDHIFNAFRSKNETGDLRRVMFGSDWPVCNVGGPKGELSWGLWVEVVEMWVKMAGDGDGKEGDLWWRAGCEAYGIEELGGEKV